MEIKIKNFQSIKDVTMSFDKGNFVVVNGKTSSGKSAFRRAISTLFFNEWHKSFIRNNEKQCSVSYTNDDFFFKIDKPSNTYTLNDNIYNKIGTNFPDELKSKMFDLGIKYMSISDNDYNIMLDTQLGGMFMIEDSESSISKILSRIFDIDKYAIAMQFVSKDIYNTKVNITNVNNEIMDVENNIANCDKQIVKIKQIIDSIDNYNLIYQYNETINTILHTQNSIKKLKQIVDIKNKINLIDQFLVICDKSEITKVNLNMANLSYIQHYSNYLDSLNNTKIIKTAKLQYNMFMIDKIKLDKYFSLYDNNTLDELHVEQKRRDVLTLKHYVFICDNNKIKHLSNLKELLIKLSSGLMLQQYLFMYENIESLNMDINENKQSINRLKEQQNNNKDKCPNCGFDLSKI